MNINGKLDLFKNSLGSLRLDKNDMNSTSMKTNIASPEEKSVAMNLLLDQEAKGKEALKKKKKSEENKKVKETIIASDDNKKIERDPLILLRLL